LHFEQTRGAAGACREGIDVMLSALPGAAEAFERAITEDSDVALANIARVRIHCFYQQGEAARKVAAAARAKMARCGTAREEPCRIAPHATRSRHRHLVRPDPSTARKSRPLQRGQASSSSGPAKRHLVWSMISSREIDELPYLMAGLLPGASGMQVVEDARYRKARRKSHGDDPAAAARRAPSATLRPEQGHLKMHVGRLALSSLQEAG
jgi:hypothetical protein